MVQQELLGLFGALILHWLTLFFEGQPQDDLLARRFRTRIESRLLGIALSTSLMPLDLLNSPKTDQQEGWAAVKAAISRFALPGGLQICAMLWG